MIDLYATKSVQTIEAAIREHRLPHALLIHGHDIDALQELALYFAGKLLERENKVADHPDVLQLSPAGKARQIRIGNNATEPNTLRALIHGVALSPTIGKRKVAIVSEIDRMNQASANAFLKTLEEPPANTTLFLLTTRPYDLLPTIRSRCLIFKIPTPHTPIEDPLWQQWLGDYSHWLEQLKKGASRANSTELVMTVYGLASRFTPLLQTLAEAQNKASKEALSDTLSADQIDAIQAGQLKTWRQRMLLEVEQKTRDTAIADSDLAKLDPSRLAQAIRELESCVGLMEVNFNADAALEHFLLQSLRIWTRR